MQIDLLQHEPRTEPFHAQVCIVGAGIAGLTLAHRLSQQGIGVALLEAGGLALESAAQVQLASARLTGTPHLGTRDGRFQAFGGASLRWGGQLLPAPELLPGWAISRADLDPFIRSAEDLLDVDDLPYEAAPFFAAAHLPSPELLGNFPQLTPRLSKWAPFARRNLAATLGRDLLAHPGVDVYLHAPATDLVLDPTGTHLQAVIIRTPARSSFRIEARHFVLAAGAVEISRLLLASRGVAPDGVGNGHDQVGRNFHDHLTLPAAIVSGPARSVMLAQLRPWLTGHTLHSIKLEAPPALCRELALNPVLAHLAIDEPEDSGVGLIRTLLTSRQQGGFGRALSAHAARLPAAVLDAARLATAARFQHRRFVSSRALVTLHFNAVQDSPSISRITLSEDLDPLGRPRPIVDWRLSDREILTLRNFAAYVRNRFESTGFPAGLDWNPELFTPEAPLHGLEDARHAMGGACMGDDPRSSVVDSNLTVHGVANLHIAGAATFPSGAPQLPTLTLMALVLRLAGHLMRLESKLSV